MDVSYDGEEGLYMALNYPSDVVILDIMLPGLNGLECLSRMRGKGVTDKIRHS